MNVGSPDAPSCREVRRFLTLFLNDKRVIDLPWLFRKILVNGIIVPFRIKKSATLYKRLWTEKGSPLIYLSGELKEKLQLKMGSGYKVFVAMRYGEPGYKTALAEIKNKGFEKLVLMPLFPQHALATTETALVAAKREIKKQGIKASVFEVGQFYQHREFIKTFAWQVKKYKPEHFDYLLFSFHGIPIRQDQKSQPWDWRGDKKYSYREACFQTARLIANELGIAENRYSVSFQSRLSKNWLAPFSDEMLLQKLKEGKKEILVMAPSFVTDCLETIVEIEQDYREMFIKNGGKKLQLVAGLNTENKWVSALAEIISETMQF